MELLHTQKKQRKRRELLRYDPSNFSCLPSIMKYVLSLLWQKNLLHLLHLIDAVTGLNSVTMCLILSHIEATQWKS